MYLIAKMSNVCYTNVTLKIVKYKAVDLYEEAMTMDLCEAVTMNFNKALTMDLYNYVRILY